MRTNIGAISRVWNSRLLPFLNDRRGNVALVLAIVLVPCLVMIGMGIDYATHAKARVKLQQELDTAVLSAVKTIGTTTDAEIAAFIKAWLAEVLPDYAITVATPTINRTDKTITASATISVPTTLTQLIGVNTLESTVSSTATGSNKTYMEVYFLLDNSASMGLAATTAGQTTMTTYASCVFACHDQEGNKTYTYNKTKYTTTYALAKALGVTLRTDVMNTAAKAVLDMIDEMDADHERIKVGVYYFNKAITTAQALSYSTTSARSALSGTYASLGVDGSYFDVVMPAMAKIVGTAGDGSSAASPKKLVLLVTDGTQSLMNWAGSSSYRTKVTPLNPAWCANIKTNGATLGVLYTEYLAVASDSIYANTMGKTMSSSVWTSTWGGTLHSGVSGSTIRRDYLDYALSDCATSSDYFISASDTDEITSGLTTLFDTWTSSIRLSE